MRSMIAGAPVIIGGGLLAGTLHLGGGALIVGGSPLHGFQLIASGLLGTDAFSGGLDTALLGAALHYATSIVTAAIYWMASTRLERLAHHWLVGGTAFGILAYGVMNVIVVPLSQAPPPVLSLRIVAEDFVAHILLFGIPIAVVWRLSQRSAIPNIGLMGIMRNPAGAAHGPCLIGGHKLPRRWRRPRRRMRFGRPQHACKRSGRRIHILVVWRGYPSAGLDRLPVAHRSVCLEHNATAAG
jgi:hypothetical protein